ncbi:DUF563 domain-containing protein [Trichocoleus sp. FACHB-262]|uniref:glycosyltransferase family 61 protein n=1 Tax=Trichocoleus sp. FACHB-262 TaxID=2692869 RepID=UPI001688DDE9|nr:glycosyltransferase family 61 protein [Trichocoleus sp. FACHB-262]MBD2124677.1 glycosyltransferase family 61 protein [Trichocoleus sp. FACHB-262]
MEARIISFYRRIALNYSSITSLLKKTLKKIYLSYQPYDGPTLFLTRGPIHCGLASEIAIASGGYQIIIRREDERRFEIPLTDNPNIANFFSNFTHSRYPPVSITAIPGGHIYSDGAVFSPDGTVLARDLSLDFSSPIDSHYLCRKPIHKSKPLTGSTLAVASWQTRSYYHWLLDELPRYLLPDIPAFDQIVCSRDTAINREALRALGLENKKILPLDQAKHYECDLLITPSYIAPTGEPSLYLVELLTEAVQSLISTTKNYPEKIFISRKSARGRRIINEDAIFQLFEAQGYTRINLENLPWRDQINIFYYAQEIFAPHGAGLANLVFCSRKPLVIELFNTKYLHWCFWRLATLVGARYMPIAFPLMEPVEHNLAAGNLDIDVGNPAAFISIYQSLKE